MITSVRTTTHRGLAAGLALVALNSLGLCNTWIVDKLNGPGTNFVDIPPAIAAAAPGDVIIVRTGIYAPFTLSHGLSILGQGSVRTSGAIAVNAVPAGEIAVIRNVVPNLLVSWGIAIQVSSCSGVVLLQRLDCHIGVNASTDVRIQDVTSGPVLVDSATGLEIVDSRVQIVKSSFSGGWGKDADCVNMGGDGGTGVYCLGASRVHFSLSTARGGGKGADDPVCGQPSGYIGSGLVVGDYPPLNRLELISPAPASDTSPAARRSMGARTPGFPWRCTTLRCGARECSTRAWHPSCTRAARWSLCLRRSRRSR